jgi:hypothetical protein
MMQGGAFGGFGALGHVQQPRSSMHNLRYAKAVTVCTDRCKFPLNPFDGWLSATEAAVGHSDDSSWRRSS